MKIPTLDEAEKLLTEAEQRNPGPWVAHSRNVALAAKCIAEYSNLDAEAAYILGLLHDVGRQEGVTSMRHTIDGYTFLKSLGYDDAARIALTHSFPYKHVDAIFGHWDCTLEERKMVEVFLEATSYDDYDRLLQLCDCVALSTGLCLLEKRMIDVALRHGVNEYTVPKWEAFVDIQKGFEQKIGHSVYKILPGVIETTFGFSEVQKSPCSKMTAMKIPTLDVAERLLIEAETLNPGSWIAHSKNVALAAKYIAEHSNLDAEAAYILGLLHDIGRREGITKMRHTLDGFRFLQGLGFDDAARICITHSFVLKNMDVHEGRWDCSTEELKFITDFVNATEFDDYDRLFQLCDALALAEGVCLLEKRIVNVALRVGVNNQTVAKWKALFEVRKEFEQKMGQSIYKVLPDVVETTFGF